LSDEHDFQNGLSLENSFKVSDLANTLDIPALKYSPENTTVPRYGQIIRICRQKLALCIP